MTVRLKTNNRPGEWLAVVDSGSEQTRVRFTRSNGPIQWKCDSCGPHRFATCLHERAALTAWRNRKEQP